MDVTQTIGLIAGALTTLSFVPQVIKTYQTKSAKDLSLAMFSIFCLGITLWLAYGILVDDLPVIMANAVTLSLAGLLLYFKLTYKN